MSQHDPFKPPNAPLDMVQPPRPVWGIVMGYLVDIGGTIFFSVVLAVFYSILLTGSGLTEEEAMTRMANSELLSPLGLVSLAMGFGMSFLGGLTCVRAGRLRTLGPAAVLAALVGATGLSLSPSDEPLGTNLMLTLFSAATVMLGAWWTLTRTDTDARP